ncbi:hypothetical protein [Echinicola vietnamensis]|uniref:Conjugal transfer protein TraI n=1 Tax=Echinicola vietnamensis (strain DSM 17526 / LMG 23754 / KMM 6221) TaxID=926556 RepID=L0G5L6_ECHVK|nr:hypothetical protein [Echinicola vietnamensis]AGA80306.1 hypothetical protein Echvi_4099 [Echinicola vietnamensis DSM 17526]
MKRNIQLSIGTCTLVLGLSLAPLNRAEAIPLAAVLEIIKQGVKKVIKAIDLKIQRLQNQTIWLQNAQKVLENAMTKLELEGIGNWSEKQREQYGGLFDELWKVKQVLSQFQRVRDIAQKQAAIVGEYQKAWKVLSRSTLLTTSERDAMAAAYTNILEQSVQNLQHLTDVLTAYSIQMGDAERLEIIYRTDKKVQENLNELRSFNRRNFQVLRAREYYPQANAPIKSLYDLY